MNATHLEHVIIALGIQCLLWPFVGRWVGGALIVSVFLGREIAQHEYAGGGPNTVSYFYGLFHHWSPDSILDVLSPAIACLLLASVASADTLWRTLKSYRTDSAPARCSQLRRNALIRARPSATIVVGTKIMGGENQKDLSEEASKKPGPKTG